MHVEAKPTTCPRTRTHARMQRLAPRPPVQPARLLAPPARQATRPTASIAAAHVHVGLMLCTLHHQAARPQTDADAPPVRPPPRAASARCCQDTVLFPSCFDANAGLFEALLGPEDAVISDEASWRLIDRPWLAAMRWAAMGCGGGAWLVALPGRARVGTSAHRRAAGKQPLRPPEAPGSRVPSGLMHPLAAIAAPHSSFPCCRM